MFIPQQQSTIISILKMMNNKYCINEHDVERAYNRINKYTHRTPVLTCSSFNQLVFDKQQLLNRRNTTNAITGPDHPPSSTSTTGAVELFAQNFFFKVEALQRTGSFKFRGALNAVLSIVNDDETIHRLGVNEVNVVTHSSGNHAAALSLAARVATEQQQQKRCTNNYKMKPINVHATIVMPNNAPDIKKNAVKGYGGEIIMVENTNEAREEMAEYIVQKRKGSFFVHPSEDTRVIAGQGTVCYEFIEQVREMNKIRSDANSNDTAQSNDLDVVIIPVGGGGLASGNTIALRGMLSNKVKIVLAEPSELDDAKRSKDCGELLKHDANNKLDSVADGLKTTLGPNTWPIVRDLVDDIITVSEEEILRATKFIWERMKICIEPSAGVGVAVACSDEFMRKYRTQDGFVNIGIVLCGGNVDIAKITKLMQEKGI